MIPIVGCTALATPVILFISPFHDIALWTEWDMPSATLRSAVAFPGDLLLTTRPTTLQPTPGWMRMPSASRGDVLDAAYRSFILESAGFRRRVPVGCKELVPPPTGLEDATARGITRARLRMTAGINTAIARVPLLRLHSPVVAFFQSGNTGPFTVAFGAPPPPDVIKIVSDRRALAVKVLLSVPWLPVLAVAGTGNSQRGFIVYADAFATARFLFVEGGAPPPARSSIHAFSFVQ
jgi:hypothetical protein